MTYIWTIEQCEHLVSTGYITTGHWRVTAQDGDYTASVYGTVGFGEGSPTIPYDQVTEQEVLDWAWANGVDKDEIEANLEAQIDALKNPTQESGVPWAQSE
jgi:hypothetical protein